MALRIIPLLLFLALAGFFGFRLLQLDEDPNSGKNIPSPLIGKPVPEFNLPGLHNVDQSFSRKDLLGSVDLVVVWASWCPSCIGEQPLLLHMQKEGIVRLVAINYKDKRGDAQRWLKRFGDPFELIGFDENGRAGLEWGVYAHRNLSWSTRKASSATNSLVRCQPISIRKYSCHWSNN